MSTPVYPKASAPSSADTDASNLREISNIVTNRTQKLALVTQSTPIKNEIQQWIERAGLLYDEMSAAGQAQLRAALDGNACREKARKAQKPPPPAAEHTVPQRVANQNHKAVAQNSIDLLTLESAGAGKTPQQQKVYQTVIDHLKQEIHVYDYWGKLLPP